MSIGNQITQVVISTFADLIGQGDIFTRIVKEIERVNETMPNGTGADKRHKVLADLEIIFDDLIKPVAESVLRLLLELGVAWVKAQVK